MKVQSVRRGDLLLNSDLGSIGETHQGFPYHVQLIVLASEALADVRAENFCLEGVRTILLDKSFCMYKRQTRYHLSAMTSYSVVNLVKPHALSLVMPWCKMFFIKLLSIF